MTTYPILRLGSKGPDVEKAQRLLSSAGYKCGTPDGDFGNSTRNAVLAFQLKNFGPGETDGIIGDNTWKLLLGQDHPVETGAPGAVAYTGVKVFNKGEDIQLSPNFHLSEWACKCSRCKTVKVDFNHVRNLQAFRTKIGRPISINSAYRCPAHNAEVGGVPNSEHCLGCATDCAVSGMSPSAVANAAENFDGVGRYSSFTHLDSRGYKARWNG